MSDPISTPSPLSSIFGPPKQPLDFYTDHVKRMLILVAANGILPQTKPDLLLELLYRTFQHKRKVILNLAVYVKREVEERNHPLNDVLNNVTFFTQVLFEYSGRNEGQPLNKEGIPQ